MECCCCFCCRFRLGLVCEFKGPDPVIPNDHGRQKKKSREALQFFEMIKRIDDVVANQDSKYGDINNRKRSFVQTGKERRIFRSCLMTVICMDLGLLIVTLIWTFLSVQSKFWFWTRIGNVVRMILLMATLFQNVDLYAIKGEGRQDTLLRHFSIYPSLGVWVLVGFLDYYLLRWPLFIGNWIYYGNLLVNDNSAALLPFIYFLSIDFAYLAESHLSLYLVYRRGVWRNILNRLRSESILKV